VAAQHDFHGRLEPPELKALTLVLRYKSESGFAHYTAYGRAGGVDSNKYSLRAPREPPNNEMQRTRPAQATEPRR
jgi:hypothetical protein